MHKYLWCISLSLALIQFGCSVTRPTVNYEAIQESDISSFYVNGVSIAACQTDSCYFSLAVYGRAKIGGYGHLNVWFIYNNRGQVPYLLKPWTVLKLHIVDTATGKVYTSLPESPSKLMGKIDKEEASRTFLSLLGGAIQTAQVASSDLSSRDKWIVEKHVMSTTAQEVLNTQIWYSIIRSSVSSGLLRKNTVLPGQSVDGFVYFPLKIGDKVFTDKLFEEKRYKCRIEVLTPTGSKEVEFIPVDME